MSDSKPVIGLMRHGDGETGGSVKYYFSSLRQGLETTEHLELLPGYYYQLPVPAIKSMMQRFLTKIDVLYATNGNLIDYVICPFYMRRKLGLDLPIIYQPLGEFPRGAAGFRSIYKYLTPRDKIVFSSSADQAIYHRLFSNMPCADQVVPFGVDCEHFSASTLTDCASLRADLGLKESDKIILYVGRITAEKNVHALLDVFSKIYRKCPDAYLLILGEVKDVRFNEFATGPHDLKALFKQMDLGHCTSRIRFFGAVSHAELPHFYSIAQVFVNLSTHHDENFGFTQVEAMSCGLPVVVSDWGGLQDTVSDECGIKIPVHITAHGVRVNRAEAVRQITNLLLNQEYRNQLAQNARDRVISTFSVQQHVNEIRHVVHKSLFDRAKEDSERQGEPTELGQLLIEEAAKLYRGESEGLFSSDTGNECYQQLIKPYAHIAANSADYPASLSLASPFTTVDNDIIKVSDPLWPFELNQVSELGTSLVHLIAKSGSVRIDQLDDLLPFASADIDDETENLVRQGVLLIY